MDTKQEKEDKPIPGPEHVGPDYLNEPDWDRPMGPALYAARLAASIFRKPAHWVRENIVLPNKGPKYYWYHRKYGRAVPIDECYLDDHACVFEAGLEYRRNKMVDVCTLDLLRARAENCHIWWMNTKNRFSDAEECKHLDEIYDREEINFFTKYGEMQFGTTAVHAYTKQKHRMIMERRKALAAKEKEQQQELASQAS